MLSKLRQGHPFLFAIFVYIVFTVCMQLSAAGSYKAFQLLMAEPMADQLSTVFAELFSAAILCLVLRATGRLGLITKKGRGFVAGLAAGGYCLCFIMWLGFQAIASEVFEGTAINFTVTSVAYVLGMLCVGITEEIEARVLIGQTFLEHYGTKRDAAIKAAIFSGVAFGLMHMTNALVDPLPNTIEQVCLCISSGLLYGAIYFRSGNLWAIAVIHGLNDVAASAGDWLFNGGVEVAVEATGFSAASLIYVGLMFVIEVSVAIYLLRPARIGEVAEAWPEIGETPADEAAQQTA